MSASAAGRTRLPRAERERQILETAHRLFAEHGYAAVTMDQVAAAVGVTKPLLYGYFGNKEQLYLGCMQPAGEALVAAVVGAVEGAGTPREALRAGVGAFFAFVDEDRSAWRVLFDETVPRGELAQRVAVYRERLTSLITAAQLAQVPAGERERVRVKVEGLSAMLLGAAESLARWWLRTEQITAAEAAGLLIATLEPGLRDG